MLVEFVLPYVRQENLVIKILLMGDYVGQLAQLDGMPKMTHWEDAFVDAILQRMVIIMYVICLQIVQQIGLVIHRLIYVWAYALLQKEPFQILTQDYVSINVL